MEMIKTVPSEIRKKVSREKVILAGFGAGPGFAAQKAQVFSPPADFDCAMAWLEGYRHVIKRARLEFKDGSRMYFYGRKFERYEPKRSFDGKEAK